MKKVSYNIHLTSNLWSIYKTYLEHDGWCWWSGSPSVRALGLHQSKTGWDNPSTCKAWAVLPLVHTGVQLSFPNMVCLHFSVTHRSTVTPVAPPASNHRASPLWTARPGFQSCDSNPFQLNKTSSENSGVGGYLTGESNYNWHLNTRQTAATWH